MTYTRERFTSLTPPQPDGKPSFLKTLVDWLLARFNAVQRSMPWAPYADTRDFVTVGEGADTTAQLTAAISAATGGTLFLAPRVYRLSTAVTFPTNLKIVVANGAMLRAANAITPSILSAVDAGPFQWLDYTDGGSYSFVGNTNGVTFLPQWFGVVGDNTNHDDVPLNRMYASVPPYKPKIKFAPYLKMGLWNTVTMQTLTGFQQWSDAIPFDRFAHETGAGPFFIWNGSDNVQMWSMDNCGHGLTKGLAWQCTSSYQNTHGAKGAVVMRNLNAMSRISTENHFEDCCFIGVPRLSTNVLVGVGTDASDNGSNNEQHRFYNCQFLGGSSAFGDLIKTYGYPSFNTSITGAMSLGGTTFTISGGTPASSAWNGLRIRVADAGANIVAANFTPTSSTTTSLTLNPPGWPTNGFIGYYVDVVSGTGAGSQRLITSNSSNTVNWSSALTLDGTSVVRILQKTALDTTATYVSSTSLTLAVAASFAVSGTRFLVDESMGVGYGQGAQNNHKIRFERCQFKGNAIGRSISAGDITSHKCNNEDNEIDCRYSTFSGSTEEHTENGENSRQHATIQTEQMMRFFNSRSSNQKQAPNTGWIEVLGNGSAHIDYVGNTHDQVPNVGDCVIKVGTSAVHIKSELNRWVSDLTDLLYFGVATLPASCSLHQRLDNDAGHTQSLNIVRIESINEQVYFKTNVFFDAANGVWSDSDLPAGAIHISADKNTHVVRCRDNDTTLVSYTTYVTYKGSGSIDPANLASGGVQSVGTVTVTGAVVGDHVRSVNHANPAGTFFWGIVTSANTVTVYQRNDTGAAVDVGSASITVIVEHPA